MKISILLCNDIKITSQYYLACARVINLKFCSIQPSKFRLRINQYLLATNMLGIISRFPQFFTTLVNPRYIASFLLLSPNKPTNYIPLNINSFVK